MLTQFEIRLFCDVSGKKPVLAWLNKIKDKKTKQVIQVRLDRLSLGLLGTYKSLGQGVYEIKIAYGPG